MVSGELCDRVTHYDILKLVSGIDRLAEVNGLDGKDLRAYAVLSRRGEIWDYITDATVGVLHSSEHRGGAGTALDRGVCSVAWCCGITSQMRRSASSIPANIAEGQARRSTGEFVQSLGVARGSLAELETFLTLSTKLEMTTPEQCRCLLNDCAEISKMLNALIKSLSTLHSPLSTSHSPLATRHSPLATRHSPLVTLHSPLSTLHSPLSTSHSPLVTLHSPLSTLHSPLTTLH